MKTIFDISIDFEKSHGTYLFDKKSNHFFLDAFSMFSSLPLGYNHPIFNDEFDRKIKHISHLKMCNSLFHSTEFDDFEKKIKEIGFHQHFYFCCTGALAVEAALKCGYEYAKNPSSIVIGLKNSFHGINSWGFITDQNIETVKNRVINYPRNAWKNIDIDEMASFIENNKHKISSVIIEPIQCTAGDIYIDAIKIHEIQNICKKNNICFIIDEIQTGVGVTGDYWYSNKLGLDPDIIVFGKKSQVSGIMVNDKYSSPIYSKYRKLEVTFDGDLLDMVRAQHIIDVIQKQSLLTRVNENSHKLKIELSNLVDNYRSTGHLIAFDFKNEEIRDKFVAEAYLNCLLVNPTAEKSVRLRPNLAYSDNELDDLYYRINKSLSAIHKNNHKKSLEYA